MKPQFIKIWLYSQDRDMNLPNYRIALFHQFNNDGSMIVEWNDGKLENVGCDRGQFVRDGGDEKMTLEKFFSTKTGTLQNSR